MDCLEGIKLLDDNSVDSIVTDPPYELGFMGKKWDSTGIAYNVELWKECLRVLKPGGHLLAFGGTRTYHRMACAIEDAGFEIRDCIQWLYGSGFPKSHDISKAIDKKLGAERKVVGTRKVSQSDLGQSSGWNKLDTSKGVYYYTASATPEAQEWDGWGTALKPANEPIVVARKPISEKTIAENVMKWGTGGINIDGCRIEHNEKIKTTQRSGRQNAIVMTDSSCGFDNTKNNIASANPEGRFPANVIIDEEAGRMLDEQQEGASRFFKNIDYTREESDWLKSQSFAFNVGKSLETMLVIIESFAPESVMQNLKKLLETSVNDAENQLKTTDIDIALRDVVILPNQEDKALNDIILHFMSEMLKALKKKDDANMRQIQNIVSKLEPELRHTLMEKLKCNPVNYADVSLLTNIMMIIQSLLTTDGCAEGVMLTTIKNSMVAGGEDYEEPTRFKYCAKASKKERNMGLEDMPEVISNDGRDETLASGNTPHNRGNVPKKNHHPTVKPIKLMEYLITLITPPNGIVLDPFFGSGTTGIAAVNLGFNYIGFELDKTYYNIAIKRISNITPEPEID